jgi:hypothetical protein
MSSKRKPPLSVRVVRRLSQASDLTDGDRNELQKTLLLRELATVRVKPPAPTMSRKQAKH